MEKVKSIISRARSKDDEALDDTTGATGKVTGEGSHFGSPSSPSTDSQAFAARQHIEAGDSAVAASKAAAITPHPPTAGDGEAAVGQTSTYNSHPLSTGDNTSRVVSPTSSDPTTFQKPETSTIGSTGVGAGAAVVAARTAYSPHEDMPGGYPGDNPNPYTSTDLDPRIDTVGHAPAAAIAAVGGGAAPSTLTSSTNPTERSAEYGDVSESKGLDTAVPATTSEGSPESSKKGIVGTVLGALGLGGGAAAVAEHEHEKESAVEPSATTGVGSSNIPVRSGPPPAHHRKESIPTTAYPAGVFDSPRAAPQSTGQSTEPASGHHYGRDAAIGGATVGAAAAGAHEISQSGAGAGSTAHDTVTSQYAGSPYSDDKKGQISTSSAGGAAVDPLKEKEREARRDSVRMQAAGAFGGMGYAANEQQHQAHSPLPATSGKFAAGGAAAAEGSQMYGNQSHEGEAGKIGTAVPYGSTEETADAEESHTGRNAAIAGVAGAAGAGYGAHEISKHDEAKTEKGQAKLQKSHDKEVAKEQKAAEKAERKHEKEVAKEEKKQEKAAAKEEKKQEKQMAKDEKKHEKEGAAAVGAGAVGAGAAGGAAAYEAEKHHQPITGTGGLAATDSADAATYNKEQHYTTGMADPRADPTVRKPEIAVGSEPSARQPTTMAEYDQQHYGRDATLGAGAAGVVGTVAYEAEKHHQSSTGSGGGLAAPDAADTAAYDKQQGYTTGMADPVAGPTGPKPSVTGVAAADAEDKKVYGHDQEERHKKPSLFKRIFKRRKNKDTGESEDDEDDYEDVPHGRGESGTAASGTTGATAKEGVARNTLIKPSYNPFKKIDESKAYGEGSNI